MPDIDEALNANRKKNWTSLDDHFSHFLKFNPYSRKPNSFISYIQRQFHAIHSTHWDSCVNTVGDSPMGNPHWFTLESSPED